MNICVLFLLIQLTQSASGKIIYIEVKHWQHWLGQYPGMKFFNRLMTKVKTKRRQKALVLAMDKCAGECRYMINGQGVMKTTNTNGCSPSTDLLCRKIAYMVEQL